MTDPARIAAYVYPGWHPLPERDRAFYPGFTEWDLVRDARPQFPGHAQPRRPALGPYDDRDPASVGARVQLALDHGVDTFVYGFFWCRGKQVFEEALPRGFLASAAGARATFGIMWANRMPRRVLPVRRPEAPLIDPERLVPTDVADFSRLVLHLAERFFTRPNYLRVQGRAYFSIFDSTFFARELGPTGAALAIRTARAALAERGLPELHLVAIDPAPELWPNLAALGFDAVSHYVHLPYWRGPALQPYAETAARRAAEWAELERAARLPYYPSVAPGWDATPRGADFGPRRPDKYPWSPVVIGEHPAAFRDALARALAHAGTRGAPLTFIASLNEWSEGHYLEPDERHGTGWLEAVSAARRQARW